MPPFTAIPDQEAFFNRVWAAARRIPYGRVVTYGQIALIVTPPRNVDGSTYKAFGPRWVGSAMAHCPDDVPWQRVINSQGKISDRPGSERQRELLLAEGVQFTPSDKIDLKRYGWDFGL